MADADNPNDYDDEAFLKASNAVDEAVQLMWDAGASADDIRAAVDTALGNVE